MKILITGGAGTLGSSLIEKFIPEGHEVLVIDNFATGKREVVPDVDGLTLIEGDIADNELVQAQFASFKPEIVIHSAAAYKDPSDWTEDTQTNVIGSINVAKAALECGVKKVINFQTALCYGRPKSVPIKESFAPAPFTSYGISKTAGENYMLNSGLNVISFRLANICGPRLSIGPIPTFYQRLKDGKSCFCSDTVRDFLDISDFLNLIETTISTEIPTGVYNISTGVGSSIKEVFEEVVSYLGLPPQDVPVVPAGDDDVQAVVLDPSLAKETFNWEAKVDFKNTIRKQLEWYDKHGITAIYSHLSEPKNV
jgi:nucleoside-diphosphate-sugar epimerase